ncbi:MAG: hypothetical protein OEY19_03605 [Gammaproteobacteria bacterium]|nr:hypothetical protein [Gammaproteobacteria bacterium]MDH5630324.1 hypothetical protein [Gammaproteobacteria bacterium]
MTGTYDWNPMPHKVDILCPQCNELAVFEFAELVRIKLKKDIPFFQDSDLFEYHTFSDSCGHKWHAAIYFAGLHGSSVNAISDLPENYKPDHWAHSKYLTRSNETYLGSYACPACKTNNKHTLQWPEDAYYSIEHKGKVLWAFNRESATDLYDFLNGSTRKVDNFKWQHFLLHIPTVFKTAKARDSVVKKLAKLLET